MSLLESLHKPLKPSVVQFLRSQECGFADGLPKICCGVLPKTIRINKTHEKKVKKSKQRSKQLAITEKQDGNGIWKPHFNISVSTAPPGASVAHHLRGIIRDEEATIFKQAFEKLLVGNTRIDLTYNLPMRRRRSHDLDIEPPRGDICIEIRKCPYFADLLDTTHIPRPRHVIKLIREHQCGFLGNVPKVCCNQPQMNNTINNMIAKKRKSVVKSTVRPFHSEIFIKPPNVTNHRNIGFLPKSEKCGSLTNDFRITGGSSASLMEFPWMALLAYNTNEGLDFRCGGTLINERYVLTAAHCILNLNLVGVRLGEQNINSKFDCDENSVKCAPPVQDFYVEDVLMHPEYIPSTFTNDIALIRLATPANLTTPNVEPICLPLGNLATYNLEGKYATISGWGITETGYKSAELLKVTVPVISSRDCRKIYAKYTPINEKQMCAGGFKGRDSCGGDSGGPLKYVSLLDKAGPRYVQHAIVSYGPRNCGTDGQPGVYTKVAYYLDWILDNMRK